LGALSGAVAPALGAAIEQELTSATIPLTNGRPVLTFYVAVDPAGRVVEYEAGLPGTGDGTAIVHLSAFGEAVHVAPPASSRVIDISALSPSGERENNGGGDSDGG